MDKLMPYDAEREPFVIRAHHTHQLFNILGLGKSIEATVARAEAYSLDKLPRSYYLDTFGGSDDRAEDFRRNFRNFLQDFLELPDDAPVKLVENQKDGICRGCAIGSHCDVWGTGDVKWLHAAQETAEKLGMAEDLTETNRSILHGMDIRRVKSIDLPAGTAKAIFSDPKYYDRRHPRSFISRLRNAKLAKN